MKKGEIRREKIEKHKITPGLAIDSIVRDIDYKKHSVAGIKNDDTKNRNYVVDKIVENISKGMTEEEALNLIMKDDVVKNFEYLQNNGCNIKECFKNWARGYIKRKGIEIER